MTHGTRGALAAALLAMLTASARAELVEMERGGALQGRILEEKCNEESLALELHDTGGVLVLPWRHVLATRRTELQERLGLAAEDLPASARTPIPEEASELADRIRNAMRLDRWNDARELVRELGERFPDAAVRGALRLDRLADRVESGRDAYLRAEVPAAVHRLLPRVVLEKARERADRAAAAARGPGTLADARRWAVEEMWTLVTSGVAESLELSVEEAAAWWDARRGGRFWKAPYGTGTYLVEPLQGGGVAAPGAGRPDAETWWTAAPMAARAAWLQAFAVESSGRFEIVRLDRSRECRDCGGRGVLSGQDAAGRTVSTWCPVCHGAGRFRTVVYR